MKIVNLIEDKESDGFLFEHGLSFYIESSKHRVLFDTGATAAFMENARRLGIDLTLIDTVIISHGHYDHAGGLLAFYEINPMAKIYMSENAAGDFYNLKYRHPKYIGIDKRICELPSLCKAHGNIVIDDELSLFGGVEGRILSPRGNESLQVKCGNGFSQDEFSHEQYLVISEADERVLISGCAHKGIINILNTYRDIYGGIPTSVISGFHTVMPEYSDEDDMIIRRTAYELVKTGAKFYTGHCTSAYSMEILRKIMGENLIEIHSGDTLISK